MSCQAPELISVTADGIDYERILELQNKLPHHLESYALEPDFCPDQSFKVQGIGEMRDDDFSLNQWREAAFNRPFFFYKTPIPITRSSMVSRQIFLERTNTDWWSSDDLMHTTRDYFVLEDKKGNRIWAFRDHSGAWYKHGIYS